MGRSEEVAWAGGLFEGEGSIAIGEKGRGAPRLILHMTDADIVLRFAEIVGAGRTYGPYHDGNPKHQPLFTWQTTNFEHSQAAIAVLWSWLGPRRKARYLEVMRLFITADVKRNRTHARYELSNPGLTRTERVRLNNIAYNQEHAEELRRKRLFKTAVLRDNRLNPEELRALGRTRLRSSWKVQA